MLILMILAGIIYVTYRSRRRWEKHRWVSNTISFHLPRATKSYLKAMDLIERVRLSCCFHQVVTNQLRVNNKRGVLFATVILLGARRSLSVGDTS